MIIGKKIILRAIEENDLQILLKWTNDPSISELVGGWSFPLSIGNQKEWYINNLKDPKNKRFIVETKESKAIGLTGLWSIDWQNRHALTALKIGEKNIRGKGYGTDAIMTIMAYAFFEVGLNKLWGEIINYNIASYKAYIEKCGWKVEGILRQHIYRKGKFYDLIRVGILKESFIKDSRAIEYIPPALFNKEERFITIKNEHKANI